MEKQPYRDQGDKMKIILVSVFILSGCVHPNYQEPKTWSDSWVCIEKVDTITYTFGKHDLNKP